MKSIYLLLVMAAVAGCGSPGAPGSDPAGDPPPLAFDGSLVTEASARLKQGNRLTWVLGCRGCHGEELEGHDFYGVPSANLTRDVPTLSDAQFARLLRTGQRTDGRDMWAMPSEIFQHLSDPDMAALLAYLRTVPPSGKPTPPLPPFAADVRKEIAAGTIKPAAQWVAESRSKTPVDLGPGHALGRYITMVTCAECHGPRLEGYAKDTPDLIVAGAYSREEFETLLTTGVPNGPRKLDLMAEVAKHRFSRMTRSERDAVHAYLKARAEQPR